MKDIDFSNKLILVTGGTGFIGGRLIEKLILQYNAKVKALVRDFSRAILIARFPVEIVKGDITNSQDVSKAVEGCEFIFHCAYGNSSDINVQRLVNVEGTRNVMESALRHSVKRVVHISTAAVYEYSENGYLNEQTPYQYSGNIYSETKLDGEKVMKRFIKQGLPAVIIQPTVVYGPQAPVWTVKVLDKLKKANLVIGDGKGLCNPVYIDDLVDAILLAAVEEKANGQSFLISAEEPATWEDFYGAYEQMLGVDALVYMSDDEINQYLKKQKKRKNSLECIRGILQQAQTRQRLLTIPIVMKLYKLARRIFPSALWLGIKSLLIGKQKQADCLKKGNRTTKPLIMPNIDSLRLLKSKRRVCIDKAKDILGYRPAFDLKRGMYLTEQWARWANLL